MKTYKLDIKKSISLLSTAQKIIIYISLFLTFLNLLGLLFLGFPSFWLTSESIAMFILIILFFVIGKNEPFYIEHNKEMTTVILGKKNRVILERCFISRFPFTRQYKFKQVVMMREYREDGTLYSETPYKNGHINGERKIYSPTGFVRRSTMYIEDQVDGWDKKLDSGQLSVEQHFKDAKLHGVCKEFDPITGAMIKLTSYKNNKLWGPTKIFDKDTKKILREIEYVDGIKSGISKEFFPDGKIKSETEYSDNRKNGTQKEYYQTGNIKRITTFLNNMKNGTETTYYESGIKLTETNFKLDKQDGAPKYFDPEGNPLIEE